MLIYLRFAAQRTRKVDSSVNGTVLRRLRTFVFFLAQARLSSAKRKRPSRTCRSGTALAKTLSSIVTAR